jgi:hypothetical protein
MVEKSPREILNEFKDGKINDSAFIEKLLSLNPSRDETLGLEIADILLEMYRTVEGDENADSIHLRHIMEEKLGEKFISKYNVVPREAMALGLIELIMQAPLENDDEIPNIHHVHAAFRIRNKHIFDLDIVEMGCPKVLFLDLLPFLESLSITQAGLIEIEGLEKLEKLELLDLAVNSLTDIKGLENLVKLKKLYVYSNRISHLNGLSKLSKLEELLIHENPIKKLKGIKNLKNLKTIELHDTHLTEKEIKKIKNLIKNKIL